MAMLREYWFCIGLLLVSGCLSGCGGVFSLMGSPDSELARDVTSTVRIETDPAGAQVFEQTEDGYALLGTTPTDLNFDYQVKGGRTAGTWVGWLLGTPIDLGLTYLSAKYYRDEKDSGGSTGLALAALVTMGVALAFDGLILIGEAPKPVSREVKLVARTRGYQEAQRTIDIATASDLTLKLLKTAEIATAEELDARDQPTIKRNLGKVLVFDIRPGRGISSDLGRLVTNLTASELQRRSSQRVIGLADVDTVISAQKAKDALGCGDTACYAEIGGMLGTDLVLAGELEVAGSYLIISYRFIDPKRTEVRGRVSHRLKLDNSEARAQEDAVVTGIPKAIQALLAETHD